MAGDLKSFVASAVGLEEAARGRFCGRPVFLLPAPSCSCSEEPEEEQKTEAKKVLEAVSPRSRRHGGTDTE